MAVDDGYTVALLHMDGSDASTTFTDESGKSWPVSGDAQIDTAKSKFGGASGLFDPAGDKIGTTSSTDFDMGTGDMTIDFWTWITSADDYMGLVNCWGSSDGYGIGLRSSGASYVRWGDDGDQQGNVLTTGEWIHLAMVRHGNNGYLFENGVLEYTRDVTGATIDESATKLMVMGVNSNTQTLGFTGWLDEVRISKGIARWTSNFTPPTSAYSPASGWANISKWNTIGQADIATINTPVKAAISKIDDIAV